MKARNATPDDVLNIYHFIRPYADESWHGKQCPIDPETCVESLFGVIEDDRFISIIIEDGGNIAAFGAGYHANSWWKEPDASIDFFYIGSNYRGTPAARMLASSLIEGFRGCGVGFLYSAAESGVSGNNNTLYGNLFKKFGFCDIGGGRLILNLRG